MRFVKLLAAALLLTSAALQMKITPGSWLTENATVIGFALGPALLAIGVIWIRDAQLRNWLGRWDLTAIGGIIAHGVYYTIGFGALFLTSLPEPAHHLSFLSPAAIEEKTLWLAEMAFIPPIYPVDQNESDGRYHIGRDALPKPSDPAPSGYACVQMDIPASYTRNYVHVPMPSMMTITYEIPRAEWDRMRFEREVKEYRRSLRWLPWLKTWRPS
jgi:hypothetical protein